MRNVMALLKQELVFSLRNYVSAFFSIIFPVLMLVLFGSMYGNAPKEVYGGFGSMDMAVPSYFGISLGVLALMTLPMTFAEYREKKVLKRYKATPVSPFTLLFSNFIVNVIIYIFSLILLVICGLLFYKVKFHGEILHITIAVAISVLSIFSMGILIAALAKNAKAASAIGNLIYFPMLFLSGASFPYEMLPKGVQNFSNIFPLTHSVKIIKGVWFGDSVFDYKPQILILLGVAVVSFSLSVKFFKYE